MANIGVRIIGPVNAPNELGSLIRGVAIGFSKLGIETSIGGIGNKDEPRAVHDEEYVQRLNSLLVAKHSMPYVAIHVNRAESITFIDNEAIANIAWIAPTFDKLSYLQALLLQSMPLAEIWVPTKAQASMLKSSMTIRPTRIEVVPFGVDSSVYSKAAKPLDGVRKEGHFYFAAAGNLVPEYGLDILLESFYKEFANEDKVHLLWKPTLNMVKQEEKNKVAADILNKFKANSKASVIGFIDDQNDKFMGSFMRTADCFVAPYRASGWGDDAIKALACGSSLIINNNTFNPYANHSNSNTLAASHVKISDINWIMSNPIYQDCFWSEISKASLRKAMRDAYENKTPKDSSASIVKEYEWSNVLMSAVANIKKYGEKK